MSKELEKALEALERIRKHLSEAFQCDEFDLSIIDDFNLIKQTLQVPTSEDVCKALSEWYSKEYKVDCIVRYMGSFIVETLRGGSEDLVYYDKHSKSIECCLPPHLITMIGKFYESESESNE